MSTVCQAGMVFKSQILIKVKCKWHIVFIAIALASSLNVLFVIGAFGSTDKEVEVIRQRGPNDVMIAGNSIWMPVNRLLLVRKGLEIGAIRFIKDWFWISNRFRFAEYDSYSLSKTTGNVSGSKISHNVNTAYGFLFLNRLYFGNWQIRCGSIRLYWSGGRYVYFFNRDQQQRDYGIDLAPTPWTDISQVNISDPRIRWYRYDGKRMRENIPIDSLWADMEQRK